MWFSGLEFSLWMREVPGSNPGFRLLRLNLLPFAFEFAAIDLLHTASPGPDIFPYEIFVES